MQIRLIYLLVTLLFIQCSVDENETISNTNTTSQYENLKVQNKASNLNMNSGHQDLFVGTIVTTDFNFHEKIYIKLNKNNSVYAQVITVDNTIFNFEGKKVSGKKNVYKFNSIIGSFSAKIERNNLIVKDAIINNTEAVIQVAKSTATNRRMPSLGSFISNDGSVSGTWDFMFQPSSSLGYAMTSLTIVKNGGGTFVLPIGNGDYQRACSTPSSPVPIGVINSSYFNIQSVNSNLMLAGNILNYIFVANRLENVNVGCIDAPSTNLDIAANTWSYNGIDGTSNIITSSLPDFSGFE